MRQVTLATMLSRGAAAVRARLRVVLAVYALQLGLGLAFTAGAAFSFTRVYGDRPLFTRGVGGDDVALLLALQEHADVSRTLLMVGVALLAAWMVASWYFAAGLLGALAGRGFAATAAARFGGFVRLALWSILPWLAVGGAALAGDRWVDFQNPDWRSWSTIVARPLLGYAPALALAALTCLAVDLARADLVLRGGGSSGRALLRGFKRAIVRPAFLAHFLLYVAVWLGISALYVAATLGRELPGAGGAWLLFFLRQATALARFLARAATSAGQLAGSELDVLEVRQVPERAEAVRDVVQREGAEPVERHPLDGE